MIEIKILPTREDIQQAVGRIVECFHPRKVILFGSHAHGSPARDSDADLLVIMETTLRNVEQAVAIRKAVNFPFAIDLMVRTPAQIAERLAMDDTFFKDILTKGIVLYEADDS
jgi:predicted nucleotidyltransferase